jgi:hypothetical protein
MMVLQIESPEAIDALPAIVKMGEVDAIFIDPLIFPIPWDYPASFSMPRFKPPFKRSSTLSLHLRWRWESWWGMLKLLASGKSVARATS